MICSFSLEKFKTRIEQGIKIGTCREDVGSRWRPGMVMDLWFGNPRNVRKNPHEFGKAIVDRVRPIQIDPFTNKVLIRNEDSSLDVIDTYKGLHDFAKVEGFDSWEDLKEWFKTPFVGKYITWKNFRPTESLDQPTLFN